ncbi:hypothetical protein E6P09_07080 [Haloferax mediterranei ATCC 33500]|uniref:DUF7315 domain-containing protein n=1 Tax=Haloferax mediterranei (strain ATCC 33500 / DSM 1411 / JCM 8866 / NBRC 14739 / NCIMB 2177 / R-4) TaxID=523841 RepID=I3R2S2_HALMT|nr:hypothetical protein [Haloferax mediterranei]AFK18532.1 hypothetical protein HFX_0810 [Haloferax mediterranei ATCC 33500]AHZ22088.1 hypothetical protein BM92_05185 [Haloferax mediterranei ATCC 33500]EMA02194.1 hypothetical protein C439_06425 [Haloferax mediterranei ATCC 33500]MDX5988622.1 hypothetical protein [Haloferax mediterranei ATCC 33500]QCQ75037.1 hypothetical protein E6P09_07080 [Haloferax mediterranei ATCC 33500]
MTDSDATSRTGDADQPRRGRRGRRDIVVPMRLYKTITVFSTLIAVVSVVLGFVFLDAATLQVSALRAVISNAFSALGLSISNGLLSTGLAVVGLAVIAFGTFVYILGTRFRAQGMGKSQEDSGEDSNNG